MTADLTAGVHLRYSPDLKADDVHQTLLERYLETWDGRLEPLPGEVEVIVYMRVSNPRKQERNYSLPDQAKLDFSFCKERGGFVRPENVFVDGKSADYLFERPMLRELEREIKTGKYSYIVVVHPDRWIRNQDYSYFLKTHFEMYGTKIAYVLVDYDDSSTTAYREWLDSYNAAQEFQTNSRRVLRGFEGRVDAGKPLTGKKPPIGYKFEMQARMEVSRNGRWDEAVGYLPEHDRPAPWNQAFARRLFDEVLAGVSINQIKKKLEKEGIPNTSGGKNWDRSTIVYILKDPVYYGEPHAFRWKTQTFERKDENGQVRKVRHPNRRPREEWRPLKKCVPTVTRDEWERVQVQIEANKAQHRQNVKDPEAYGCA